ncbi:MAG: autotransporter domain-containing protein [Gammaproteobacteria bacterium]|nr:MAG: autotransporter domain-containing protein [Gammaproteobacteria bacterium]
MSYFSTTPHSTTIKSPSSLKIKILSVAILLSLISGQGLAATYTVLNSNASGIGSLDEAIIAANSDPNSIIDFGNVTTVIIGPSPTALGQNTVFTSNNTVNLFGQLTFNAEVDFLGSGSIRFFGDNGDDASSNGDDGNDGSSSVVNGTAFTLTNYGNIYAGNGGNGSSAYSVSVTNSDNGGNGGNGGDAVNGTAFTLTNYGNIYGSLAGEAGAAYSLPGSNSGNGGEGGNGGNIVSGSNFIFTNSGTIYGGNGNDGGHAYSISATNSGDGGSGGNGGNIVSGSNFTFTNSANINGGNGGNGGQAYSTSTTNSGDGGNGGNGGSGVSGSNFTLINSANIKGGNGRNGGAAYPGSSSSTNSGNGGNGGNAGIAINSTGNSTIYNAGSIVAGTAGSGGTGSANGSAGQAANAISFSGSSNTLVLQAGSVITGDVISEAGSADTISSEASSTITGDVSGFSTFKTSVASDSVYSQLNVTGTLTLESSTTIEVDVTTSDFSFTSALDDGFNDVIKAATLVANSTVFTVSDNSLLFDFGAELDAANNAIDLTLEAASSSTSVFASAQAQGKKAALSAAKVLDSVISEDTSGSLASHFVSLSTAKEVADAVESTLPSVSGEVASLTSLASTPVVQSVGARQAGIASGDAYLTDRHLWFKPFGSWTKQDNRQGVTGYDIDSYGLVAGLDGDLSSTWNVGIALSYITSDVESTLSSGKNATDIDSYLATIYASKQLDDRTLWSLQSSVGFNEYDSARRLFTGDVARADYDGWQFLLSSELARNFDVSTKTTVTPYINARYSYVDVDAYRESGAGALNLIVEDDSADSLVLSAGVKSQYAASESLTILAELGAGYDVMADRSDLTAAFSGGGARFTTQGITPDKWVYNAAIGAQYLLENGTKITARYDFNGREDYKNDTLSVDVRWLF